MQGFLSASVKNCRKAEINKEEEKMKMPLLNEFLSSGFQFILMVAVVAGAAVLGATLRKKKDAAKREEQ